MLVWNTTRRKILFLNCLTEKPASDPFSGVRSLELAASVTVIVCDWSETNFTHASLSRLSQRRRLIVKFPVAVVVVMAGSSVSLLFFLLLLFPPYFVFEGPRKIGEKEKNKQQKKKSWRRRRSWHDTLYHIHIPFHNVFIYIYISVWRACVDFPSSACLRIRVCVCLYTLKAKGIRWRRSSSNIWLRFFQTNRISLTLWLISSR
jgi:hypothetical protein